MYGCNTAIDPTVIGRPEDLNPKSFPIGSVVYFLRNRLCTNQKRIEFGTVIEHYTGEIAIQLYEPPDLTLIEGVPVKEFRTPTEWRKLPKGWSYDTKLIRYGHREAPSEMCGPMHINDPEWIKGMIEKGYLIPPRENDHAGFREEIDSKRGWRIVRDYYGVEERPDYMCVFYTHVYATYQEAQAEIDAIEAECKRQAALSDREWSIEQIDRNLDMWAHLYGITDDHKAVVRARLLALENVEDVVTRVYGRNMQWKYDRNKRWLDIET